MAQSDIIITQNSTAALVPLIAHKPTILLDSWFPFLDEGLIKSNPAFLKVKNISQLPKLIDVIVSGKINRQLLSKKQDRFIHQFCGPLNTQAGKNIAKQISHLI